VGFRTLRPLRPAIPRSGALPRPRRGDQAQEGPAGHVSGGEHSEHTAVRGLLKEARIPAEGVLFVHCSFRRFHAHGFEVDRFIEALLAERRGGTLVMPAMSWRIVTPANPVFDELATPSHVGILAERFRTRFASHRSLHPTHSVAALGRRAAALTSGHHLDNTPCSLNSPYGR